jgi:hypothetical protein
MLVEVGMECVPVPMCAEKDCSRGDFQPSFCILSFALLYFNTNLAFLTSVVHLSLPAFCFPSSADCSKCNHGVSCSLLYSTHYRVGTHWTSPGVMGQCGKGRELPSIWGKSLGCQRRERICLASKRNWVLPQKTNKQTKNPKAFQWPIRFC